MQQKKAFSSYFYDCQSTYHYFDIISYFKDSIGKKYKVEQYQRYRKFIDITIFYEILFFAKLIATKKSSIFY